MAIRIFPQPSDLDSLRLSSIMNPDAYRTDTNNPITIMPVPDNSMGSSSNSPNNSNDDVMARLSQIFQPEHKYDDILGDMLNNMPTRNKPGLLRKIAAGVAAFSGPEYADRALYNPYYRQLEDWETKFKPTLEAAKLENTDNTNMRLVANTILSNEMADKRLDRQYSRDAVLGAQGDRRLDDLEERYKNLQTNAENRIKQGEERLKIAQANSRGGTFKVDDAGNPFIVYKDGSTVPVNADYLSAADKADLQVRIAESKSRATASGRPKIVDRDIEDPNNPGHTIKVRINLDTGEATPITLKGSDTSGSDKKTIAKPQTELEKSRGTVSRAQQIKNEHPEWSKYIKIDGNMINLTSPGRFFGPNQDEYNKMYNAIYGNNPPSTTVVTKASKENNSKESNSYIMTEGTPPPINQRKVGQRHKFPNGNIGEWDGKVWKPVSVVKR